MALSCTTGIVAHTVKLAAVTSAVTHVCAWPRAMLMTHVLGLFCEVGVVVVTLLELFSGLERRDDDGGGTTEAQAHSNQLAMTPASLVTTVIAFMLSMLGTGDAMSGLKMIGNTVANRVSAAMSREVSKCGCKMSGTGAAGGHNC